MIERDLHIIFLCSGYNNSSEAGFFLIDGLFINGSAFEWWG